MNWANRITILRIILIPFFIAAVVYARLDIALVFFIIAVISDGADGFIARSFGQKTELGAILDPIADKLLLTTAFICLSMVTSIPPEIRLPPYVPIIVISRDAIIVIGFVVVYMMKGSLKVVPSVFGKITTFCQMLTILCVLLLYRYSYIIWNIAVAMTLISGIDYIIRGSRMLNGAHSNVKR